MTIAINGKAPRRTVFITRPDRWQAQFDRIETAVCVLDTPLNIVYCNPAWDRFALANNGESGVGARICGTPLFRYVPRVLQYHFLKLFDRAREKHELVTAPYECNSPEVFRRFSMDISPIPDTPLLAVVHRLLAQSDIPYPAFGATDHDYGVRELVVMCAQCRRTKRLHDNFWDWVPEFLRHPPGNVSYGICQECLLLYCADPIS